jgi:hypothetical protein
MFKKILSASALLVLGISIEGRGRDIAPSRYGLLPWQCPRFASRLAAVGQAAAALKTRLESHMLLISETLAKRVWPHDGPIVGVSDSVSTFRIMKSHRYRSRIVGVTSAIHSSAAGKKRACGVWRFGNPQIRQARTGRI